VPFFLPGIALVADRLQPGAINDFLPERFIKELIPDGPCKGPVFEIDVFLDAYYKARGWDIEKGFPIEEKMFDLGLKS